MLDIERQQMNGQYYDYIFTMIVKKTGEQKTFFEADHGMQLGHIKLAEMMKQTYTAYAWNNEHGCYVQTACYP